MERESLPVRSTRIERFNLRQATRIADPLRERLGLWADQNSDALEERPPLSEDDFPSGLSFRRQDMCEPLFHLADHIGGEWPARIREAVTTIFTEVETFQRQPLLQLLHDLYACFAYYSWPQRLSSALMVEWVRSLPPRPWDIDGPFGPQTLARMLLPFGLRPRLHRMKNDKDKEKGNPARGYMMLDFLEIWRRELGASVNGLRIMHHQEAYPEWQMPKPDLGKATKPASSAACNGVTGNSENHKSEQIDHTEIPHFPVSESATIHKGFPDRKLANEDDGQTSENAARAECRVLTAECAAPAFGAACNGVTHNVEHHKSEPTGDVESGSLSAGGAATGEAPGATRGQTRP